MTDEGRPVRRVVTAIDAGRSVIARAGTVPQDPPWSSGYKTWTIWGSDAPPVLGVAETAIAPTIFPPPGGVRMIVSEIAPDTSGEDVATRLHSSETIDFAVVLSGSVHLEQGDGSEVELHPGDCVVQTGTVHAWQNRGSEPSRVAFVLLGVARS